MRSRINPSGEPVSTAAIGGSLTLKHHRGYSSNNNNNSNKVGVESNPGMRGANDEGPHDALVEEAKLLVNELNHDEIDDYDEYEDDPLSYMLDGGCCVPRINREDGDQSGSSSCDDIFHYFKRHIVDVAMEHALHFDFLSWRKTNEEEEVSKLYRKIVFKAQARERGDPAMLFYHVIKNDIHKLITKLDELEAFAIREVSRSMHRADLSQMGPISLQERVMDRMRTLVCAADIAGANIIHLAYLFKNYDIGHYLVRRFPMWAYLPYAPKVLSNRYVHRPQDAAVFAFNHEMKVLIDRLKLKLKQGAHQDDLKEKLESLMLYTGENILHMVIVHRDYNQVRWLLDFYRDRMHPFPLGLLTLLSQPATGAFFDQRTGDIYFGSTPLQFAVCSNDQEIFKLVYSCCAGVDERGYGIMKETGSDKIINSAVEASGEQPWSHNFGAYAVFQTDSEGNNALHLCALHGLSDMYQCVYDTALSLVSREIKNEYVKKISINSSTKKNVTIHLHDKILAKNCATMRLKDISIPIGCNDLDKRIDAEAQRIVDYKLVLALNRDLHSPLTLTAATMVKPPRHDILNSDDDSSDENNPSNKYHKKVDMFRILLQKLKKRQWSYGPISLYYLTLDGVAMNYKVKDRYEVATDDGHQRRPFSDQMKNSFSMADQQTTISSVWKMLTHCFDGNVNAITGSRLKNNRMLPAIAWLCVNETEKAILIPEVVEIIETKWRLMAYPTFLSSFILHLVLTLMITVALCLMNSTSTLNFGSDYSLDIVISIILIIIGASYLFLIVKQFNAYLRRGRDFFDLRGICLFDRRMRFVKIGSFVSFCICKYLMIRQRYYRDDFSSPYGIAIYHDREYQQGAMISLAVCAMVSWLHLYFFLMGFDGTGPLTLTIFRLCTVDVPYFLKFYCVVILSYASALGVLAMSGMSEQGPTFGFLFILRSIGSLIQITVGVDPTKDVLNIQTAFSSEFFWLAELLLTSYNAVVLILMINLLIAIISQTFDRYFNKSYALLLMAKYDIMHAMEKSMGVKELNETSEKYAASDDAANQEFARDDEDRLMRAQIKSFKFQMKEHNTNWYYARPEELSAKKSVKNALLIIDAQNDFHEGGLLPINGATEDSRRVAELIRKFGSNIHEIYVSLSTHHPKHIANASCWKRGAKKATSSEQNIVEGDGYEEGDHPRPFTEISYQDIKAGTWLYQFKDLRSVEMTNKFRIQVLPEHCIVGSRGQCLHPIIHDAIQGWTERCSRNVHYIFKGHHLSIEVRSALCHPTDPDASHNEDLLAKLKMNDKLFICGQAMSHCVNHTTRDLIDKWGGENLVLLKDGASSFEGFKSQSEALMNYAKQKGVTVVACEGAFEGYEPDDSMIMDEHKLLLSNAEPITVAKAAKKRIVKKITAAANF